MMKTTNWENKRVLILGAARQGLALARYLAQCGAAVTLNDQNPAEKLADAARQMNALSVRCVFGAHPLELLDEVEMVFVSGGVPLTLPIVVEAQRRGLPVSNDSQVFMDAVSAPVIGITGSAGKTTTTTLVGRMAGICCPAPLRAWVGGNIGLPLVEYLDEIKPEHAVVLELSSFQLELMTHSPHIAAVLNITPNHLDRHGTLEAYAAAKAHILQHQVKGDIAILNREEPGSWNLREMVQGELITFGLRKPDAGLAGTYYENGFLWFEDANRKVEIMPQSLILLRGAHNLANVAAACAIAMAAGFPVEAMRAAVDGFGGVEHRLELVREWRGVRWYNDSIATAPERTIAAIHSFSEPLVLLLGGRDKNLPWEDLAALIHERVDHVVVFGEAAEKIQKAIEEAPSGPRRATLARCAGLEEAVQIAASISEAGDVVLLSPGGTSYDQFKDFAERGERYRLWVKQLA